MKTISVSTFLLAAVLAACSPADEPPPEPTADEEVAAAEDAEEAREQAVASSEVLTETQAFLDDLAQQGAIQVGMAKIAMDQAEREEVKAFARQAVDVHQDMLTGLRDLAEQNENFQVSTVLSDEQERNFAQLRGARSVDDMYLERTRAAYDEIEAALANYADTGDFAALRQWSKQALARFEKHSEDLTTL